MQILEPCWSVSPDDDDEDGVLSEVYLASSLMGNVGRRYNRDVTQGRNSFGRNLIDNI